MSSFFEFLSIAIWKLAESHKLSRTRQNLTKILLWSHNSKESKAIGFIKAHFTATLWIVTARADIAAAG